MDEVHERALRTDGDGYYTRNYAGIGTIADPVFEQMQLLHRVQPIRSVFEIGCTTGFRLEKARSAFGARCAGLEISPAAVSEARERYPNVDVREGTAPRDMAQWESSSFNVVVVGHVLYLLPRAELFELAAAVDRILTDGGHIIVMDFLSPFAHHSRYSHHSDLSVFKHDPSAPWVWSPTYQLVSRQVYSLADIPSSSADPRSWQTVDVVRKLSVANSYPERSAHPSVHDESGAV